MRVLFCALLLAPAAASAQTLTASGACPGPIDIAATGLTRGGAVAVLIGLAEGADRIPGGPCADTVSGLRGIRLGPVTVSPDGNLALRPSIPGPACGRVIQVLDLESCALTNVTGFGGGGECVGGADTVSVAPSGTMILCDDPTDGTCEQDFGTLCPVGWQLCSPEQFNNRNGGWAEPVPAAKALGTIYCRAGDSGAGHFSVSYDGIVSLGEPESLNCGYGSSRATCEAGYGCNEQTSAALCCQDTPSCGNGVVDHAEELCDDGNLSETDDCLNNCTWRNPTVHGLAGVGC
ncbi:MAG: cysteine-rich repeat protein [Myxococcota bacterium]|jgi:cysteine-rich repeat protein